MTGKHCDNSGRDSTPDVAMLAPVLPPVTAETVEAHMRAEHGWVQVPLKRSWSHWHAYEHRHGIWPRPDGTPAFGHTHSPPAADEGTTT